jgi:hypothetical protein
MLSQIIWVRLYADARSAAWLRSRTPPAAGTMMPTAVRSP